jgi:hypothetical protein
MTARDRIYVEILRFALPQMRDAAEAGMVKYCAIEAEHIHNIPSLIGESNENRHTYYLNVERAYYLERVDTQLPLVQMLLRRYRELWSELEAIAAAVGESADDKVQP